MELLAATLRITLIVPAFFALIGIIVAYVYRATFFRRNELRLPNWTGISFTVFTVLYFLIQVGAQYALIRKMAKAKEAGYDPNKFYTGSEITPEITAAMRDLSSDTAQNLAPITGLIFAGLIALFVLVTGSLFNYAMKRAKSNNSELG